jgi:hypothetical protein
MYRLIAVGSEGNVSTTTHTTPVITNSIAMLQLWVRVKTIAKAAGHFKSGGSSCQGSAAVADAGKIQAQEDRAEHD